MAGKQILGILLMVIAFAAGLAFGGEIIRDIAKEAKHTFNIETKSRGLFGR